MSQFTAGFRTMERQRDAEAQFCDSDNLLQSEPNSPDVWETSTIKVNGKTPKRNEAPRSILKNGGMGISFIPPGGYHEVEGVPYIPPNGYHEVEGVPFIPPNGNHEGEPVDPEDVDQAVSGKPEFPDWRRSAVLTIFIFPPTGLLAMILACLSHKSARNGDYDRARRLNCCSCWMVFISLLASLTLIMVCILCRVYGILEPPF